MELEQINLAWVLEGEAGGLPIVSGLETITEFPRDGAEGCASCFISRA